MPYIRRFKLPASLAALVAASLLAAGCRSSAWCDRCCQADGSACCCNGQAASAYAYAPPGTPPPNSVASLGSPVSQEQLRPIAETGVSRPLWRLSRRNAQPQTTVPVMPATGQPSACEPCAAPRQQAAVMLRPVPLGAPLPETSEWSPVQRVSAEAVSPAASAPPPAQTVTEPPLLAPPAQPSLVLLDGSRGEKDAPIKDDKGKPEATLPAPRSAGPKKGAWPDLPEPAITNPPHAPREFQKHALSAYIIEPPDVLDIQAPGVGFADQLITGYHLVRPDGTIGLGPFGSVFVAGMTIDQAKVRIVERIHESLTRYTPRRPKADKEKAGGEGVKIPEDRPLTIEEILAIVKVDVAAFNSKFYYVVTDGGGYGEQVVRLPFTGNETVLDAISQIQGLPAVASKKQIWLARATPDDHHNPMILPVDWCGIVQRGSAVTNYQVFPGDRVYVNSAKLIRVDSALAKVISPIERLFGITLLGSTTINSIKGNQGGNGFR